MCEEAQGALRGHRGILLPQRSRRSIARGREQLAARRLLRRVQCSKVLFRHVDFAAHLEQVGRFSAQHLRHVGNVRDIRGDIFPHLPIAAGRRAHQPPLLITQRTRKAVDLVLGGEGQRGVFGQREEAPHAGHEFGNLLVCEGIVEAHHAHLVAHLRKRRGGHFVAHRAARRIGAHEMREFRLKLGIAAHQRIVFGVGDFGRVVGVVKPVVVRDRLGEPHQLVRGIGLAGRAHCPVRTCSIAASFAAYCGVPGVMIEKWLAPGLGRTVTRAPAASIAAIDLGGGSGCLACTNSTCVKAGRGAIAASRFGASSPTNGATEENWQSASNAAASRPRSPGPSSTIAARARVGLRACSGPSASCGLASHSAGSAPAEWPTSSYPGPIDGIRLRNLVDQVRRRRPVGKRSGPTAAIADLAVIDVERGHALRLPPRRERRHVGLVGNAGLEAAAVEDHRQRERPCAARQAQFGEPARVFGVAQHRVGLRWRELRVGAPHRPVGRGYRRRVGRRAHRAAGCQQQDREHNKTHITGPW